MLGEVDRPGLGQGVEHARGTGGDAEPATRRRELLDVTGEEPVVAGQSRAAVDGLHQGVAGLAPIPAGQA